MIEIRRPSLAEQQQLGLQHWPVWSCPPSTFDWTYDDAETCFLLEGEVEVQAQGQSYRITAGDLVRFPAGLSCVWQVKQAVRKHYQFG